MKIKTLLLALMLLSFAALMVACDVQADYQPPILTNTSSIELETISESHKDYTLNIHYPVTNQLQIDDTLYSFIVSRIIKFKDDLLDAYPTNGTPIEGHYSLDFRVVTDTADAIAIIFTEKARLGGIDVYEERHTFNFNRHSGDMVSLDELFSNSPDFLEIISPLAYQKLLHSRNALEIDPVWLQEGTLPFIQNFNCFTYQSDGLHFIFNSGQIGQGHEGAQEIILNASDFKNLLSLNTQAFSKNYRPIIKPITEPELLPAANESTYFEPPALVATGKADPDSVHKKRVALTFDDGPHPKFTTQILDILKEYDSEATFFMLGNRVAPNAAIVKRVIAEGHGIGSHSWGHPKFTALNEYGVKQQIQLTQEAFLAQTGMKPFYVRVPFGRFNQEIQKWIDMPLIQWSVDPEDWKSKNPQKIATHVLEHVQDGSIVVLHDIHGATVQALPAILKGLSEMDYECVTVESLLGITPKGPKDQVYYKK